MESQYNNSTNTQGYLSLSPGFKITYCNLLVWPRLISWSDWTLSNTSRQRQPSACFVSTPVLSSVLLHAQSVTRRRHYRTVCEDSIGISACNAVQNVVKSQGRNFVSTFLVLWTHFLPMNKHVSSFTHKPEVHLKLHIATIYSYTCCLSYY